ncbi:hypothetical protein [Piscinibacter defluvii]|uniref:hypothetical protein n=1 Tax=Piscinibacter defluvii TaxID=1796922 RepID=UPI000FDF5AD7|nr:hypothetical protein [Piscinibacter defluvii]
MLDDRQRQWLKRVFDIGAALPGADDAAEDAGVKRQVLARLEQLGPALEELDAGIVDGRFKGAGTPVKAAVRGYNEAREKLREARAKRDWERAERLLPRLEAALRQLGAESGERRGLDDRERSFAARKRYLTEFPAVQPRFKEHYDRHANQPYVGALAAPWADFVRANDTRHAAAMQRQYDTAWDQLEAQKAAMARLEPPPGKLDQARARLAALRQECSAIRAGIDAGTYPGLDTAAAAFAKDSQLGLARLDAFIQTDEPDLALEEVVRIERTLADFRKKAGGALAALAQDSGVKAQARAQAALAHDPQLLRALMAQAQGPAALDAMVKSLKGKAEGAPAKAFVEAAILARYDMTSLAGDLTTKALPRLYAVLGQVPEQHARHNPKLQRIVRNRQPASSTYDAEECKLTLNIGKTGDTSTEFDQDPDVDREARVKQSKANTFNHTTLHELGHSIDDMDKFMDQRGHHDDFGGWRMHRVDEIAEIAGTAQGFFADHQSDRLSHGFLHGLLVCTLSGRPWRNPAPDPVRGLAPLERCVAQRPDRALLRQHPAVLQAQTDRGLLLQADEWDVELANALYNDLCKSVPQLDPNVKWLCEIIGLILLRRMPADAAVDDLLAQLVVGDPATIDLDALERHPAVAWCRFACSEPENLWKRYAEKPDGYVIGGRFYGRVDGSWRSYRVAARSKGVSQYQFKAPAEWFAELYAAYQMKALPDSHPDAKWLAVHYPRRAA